MDTLQASFDLSRQTAARPWEAERARLELLNSGQTIDIQTGAHGTCFRVTLPVSGANDWFVARPAVPARTSTDD